MCLYFLSCDSVGKEIKADRKQSGGGGWTISLKDAARLADKIAETLRRASICPPLGRESWTFSQPGVGVRALEAGGVPLGSWSGTGITVATYGAGSASVDKP